MADIYGAAKNEQAMAAWKSPARRIPEKRRSQFSARIPLEFSKIADTVVQRPEHEGRGGD
jgi:hypothetical protein